MSSYLSLRGIVQHNLERAIVLLVAFLLCYRVLRCALFSVEVTAIALCHGTQDKAK